MLPKNSPTHSKIQSQVYFSILQEGTSFSGWKCLRMLFKGWGNFMYVVWYSVSVTLNPENQISTYTCVYYLESTSILSRERIHQRV